MICPNCNKENVENAKFCSSCGFALDNLNNVNNQVPNVEVNEKSPEELAKISKTAKTLTIVSICLRSFGIITSILTIVLYKIFDTLANCFFNFPALLIWAVVGVCCFASVVLIIIAETKIAQNSIKSGFVKGIFATQLVLLIINSTVMACLMIHTYVTMLCEAIDCSGCFR